MYVIEIENLTKKFGDFTAVDNISLKIKRGEIFGLLGPNGAGKTTTISMLSTLIRPTSGIARVAGYDVLKDPLKVRQNIGIVFQEPSVDDLLTGRENLELHAMLYGMDREEMNERIEEMLNLVELSDRADDLVRKYSGGMRRRLEIARGLLHTPKILFLDEPTLGLDPASRRTIWHYIETITKEKRITTILTTHYLEEADSLCDRIAIIDKGRIVVEGTSNELKSKIGEDIIRLTGSISISNLRRLKCVKKINSEPGKNHVDLVVEDAAKNLQKVLSIAGKVDSVEVRRVSLDDVFLHYTGRYIHEENGEDSIMNRIATYRSNR
ncbi:MAG: ATP-binding cassette domain-containing protein [Candidatus Micrarchaeota archaeon]|nr:ATP-binding cassette domain-containing protein [Candidatus Micrarchaeota archaeon]